MRRACMTLVAAFAVLVGGAGFSTGGAAAGAQAEDLRVLVFSRTAGFRHLSIPDGIAAITSLGEANGFAVEATEDPAIFTDADLARFDAVVFLNTTGSVMTDDGRAAFERYLEGGGGWVGVHSAADTEYEWAFYERILGGAYFLAHPVQQPGVIVNEAPDQPSTGHLPDRWTIPFEEFYSFRVSPRDRVRVLLSIDESTYLQDPNTTDIPMGPSIPEGQTGVMGDHPMSWCHDLGDGRAWYTALGHESYLYQLPDYRDHLLGGILTATRRVEADCAVSASEPTPAPVPPPAPPPAVDPGDTEPLPQTGAPVVVAAGLAATLMAVLVGRRRT